MVDHPNVRATSIVAMELDGQQRVLVVDTDLKMDPESPAYDHEKVGSLHQACRSFVDKFPLLFDTYAIRAWK
ncbi:hypothetical protein AB6806_05825 [Bosea sp. RCC_152_1]|uniref:hypothetical protein n=1 Tax=Bosea sp. RCC_152_1 TaxID=3239228 RepID=UPI00352446AA